VTRDPHDCQLVNPSPPHVRDSGVTKVMKSESLKSCASDRGLTCCLDGVNGFPVDQEDVWLEQVADLIQVFEQSGQVSGQRHETRIIRFGALCFEANQSRLEVYSVPGQVQHFSAPHPGLVGYQVDGLQVRGGMGLQLLKFFG
jgi:hypothetical protein